MGPRGDWKAVAKIEFLPRIEQSRLARKQLQYRLNYRCGTL